MLAWISHRDSRPIEYLQRLQELAEVHPNGDLVTEIYLLWWRVKIPPCSFGTTRWNHMRPRTMLGDMPNLTGTTRTVVGAQSKLDCLACLRNIVIVAKINSHFYAVNSKSQ